jgi:Fe-S-cluster-containing dehydrogenase component/CRP-like cAMP-binding protein
MIDTEVAVARPQRWDEPFDEAMQDADVDRLLHVEPFRGIDPSRFPPSLPLRSILRNDTRIRKYTAGDIVVREGDYGSSAFFIIKGRVRVVLSGLSSEALGREAPRKLGWWATLGRVLFRSRKTEVRDAQGPTKRGPVATGQRREADGPRVFLQDVPRVLDETQSIVLEAGEFFGELAALTRSPRAATVVAESDVTLLEIRWQGLRDLMRRTDSLRRHVERLYRENSLRIHLRETPLLAELPADRLEAVADATVFESHGEFDWHAAYDAAVKRRPGDAIVDEPLIAEECVPCDGLILIRTGFARQSHRYGHGHRTASYLGRGQVFGLAESIESAAAGAPAPLKFSLRALGYVDVLRIPQRVLESLVYPLVSPEALVELAREHGASFAAVVEPPPSGAPLFSPPPAPRGLVDQGLLEFLVERRLINGAKAMVIDLDRCTRCDDCVRACAATHDNNPRFVRDGPRHGPFLATHACMHCVDPVCMIGCPTGAIARDSATGVVRINDRTCIGCGVCAESCPYDNIQLVQIRDRSGAAMIDQTTRRPILKATKCDLCADLAGGPACQRACPHDALIRMDLGNLGDVAEWVNR